MSAFEIILLAVALAMDAFAVAICKGLATEKATLKNMLIVGAWFGFFQALMPFIGCTIGAAFLSYIEAFDHWIAFVLLGFIGTNMIIEALSKEDECECGCGDENASFAPSVMLTMAIATSIDALAVGLTFALYPDVNIVPAISIIGAVTFVICAGGVLIGHKFGAKFKSKAEFCGGLVLIIIGLKLLIEGLIA